MSDRELAAAAAPGAAPCQRLFVHAGQVVTADGASWLTTIVGSCISVCVWDRRRRWGGMNHFVLAEAPPILAAPKQPLSYGDRAVPELVDRLLARGSRIADLEAKVFGGANLVGAGNQLGTRNAAVALDLLGGRGIHVVARDVGGRRGRKVIFGTADGAVLVRQL